MSRTKKITRLDSERSTKIVNALGGTAKVAEELGLTKSAISAWKRFGIPEARLQFIQARWYFLPEVQATTDFDLRAARRAGSASLHCH